MRVPGSESSEYGEAEDLWRAQFEEEDSDEEEEADVEISGNVSQEAKVVKNKKKRIMVENVIGGDIFSVWHKVQTLIEMSVNGSLQTMKVEDIRSMLAAKKSNALGSKKGSKGKVDPKLSRIKQQMRLVRVVEFDPSTKSSLGKEDDTGDDKEEHKLKDTKSPSKASSPSKKGNDEKEETKSPDSDTNVGFIGLCLPRSLDMSIVIPVLVP